MVQLEKIQGQRGHMVIHEDGTVISSSGDLGSNEDTAKQVMNLVQHLLPANFPPEDDDAVVNGMTMTSSSHSTQQAQANNSHTKLVNGDGGQGQWNKITLDFGDHSYVCCLSNRKIYIVKLDHIFPNADHVSG